jgi:branched-chain amino acid transport system permease protein
MLAIREDEEALRSLGVNPIKYKVPAFAAHGALTALAGGAFALSLGFVFPTTVFSVDITITLILVVVLGGIGTVWGPVIGTLILIPLQELFWLEFPALHLIAYGLFLVGVILLMPEGIISRLKDLDILPQTRGL